MQELQVPQGFASIRQAIPTAVIAACYATSDNLTGAPLWGYHHTEALGTVEMVAALAQVAQDAAAEGLRLLIFDAYRPQRAVDCFARWAALPEDNTTRANYYPELRKDKLFELGYIAERSGHSRGSTVDLSLTDELGKELDMGTHFDFMSELSHHGAAGVSPQAAANRERLRSLMLRHGFTDYENEWWHYRLTNEPYPHTYFNFNI